MASLPLPPGFNPSAHLTGEVRTLGPNGNNVPNNGQSPTGANNRPPLQPGAPVPHHVQAQAAAALRPLRLPNDPNTGRPRSGVGNTDVRILKSNIDNMSDTEVRGSLRRISQRARNADLSRDSITALYPSVANGRFVDGRDQYQGPRSNPRTPEDNNSASMFGGARSMYVAQAHLPRSGHNSSLPGRRPLVFQGQAFNAARPFDARTTDIRREWAKQMMAGMTRARVTVDYQASEDRLPLYSYRTG